MSPKMVLMGDRKQKRPIKSRKTPKKAKNQKMSENSPNQKKQIRRNEEYSTKPEEKTYKTNKKPGIKKAQTHHRKERGNEEEKGAKNEEILNISNSDSEDTCEKSEKSNYKNSEISDQKPTTSKMTDVPEEEMWPSPFSSKAAPGFKLEVPKKLTRGEKKRLNKANREKVLKDEVMNVVTDANNDVFKMKNDVFRPSHSGPSPSSKSPPSSDKKEPKPTEKTKSKEELKSKRKKQRIMMIKSDRYFFLLPLTSLK